MHPLLRTLLFGLLACILAVWVGVSLAREEHFLASCCALLTLWAVLSWTRGPLAEGWLLGFLVFGYILGGRGFAQITPISGLPLFFAELGLAASLSLVILRGALSRVVPYRPDWLNHLLVLWLALGAARMLWDFRVYQFLALRDFATVYYGLYFFVAQALVRHPPTRMVLQAALPLTFGLLPFTALLSEAFPAFFQTRLTVGGVPLIYYKDDLLATFLFAGFIYFVPKDRLAPLLDRGRWALALLSLFVGLAQLSRAAMVGLLVGLGILAAARRWLPVRVLVAAAALGILGSAVYSVFEGREITQTKVYAIYEHLSAITDFSGSGHYRNDESADSGDNNRFRLIWWHTVAEETLQQAPVFGLGFGYDLARGFLAAYNPLMDDFTARSPHSIVFTTLGRMGLVGLACWLALNVTMARRAWHEARRVRQGGTDDQALTLYAACAVILVSACFGVVLEGPMGAVPFWIMLGLAHGLASAAPAEPPAPRAVSEPAPAAA